MGCESVGTLNVSVGVAEDRDTEGDLSRTRVCVINTNWTLYRRAMDVHYRVRTRPLKVVDASKPM